MPRHYGTVVLSQRPLEGSDIYFFCENLRQIFAKHTGFKPTPAGPYWVFSLIL